MQLSCISHHLLVADAKVRHCISHYNDDLTTMDVNKPSYYENSRKLK